MGHVISQNPAFYKKPYYAGPWEEGMDPKRYQDFMELPFVRLLYAGGAMGKLPVCHSFADIVVSVFFVISGYVLSFRQVKMIRTEAWDKLLETQFSSILRRGFRLFVPCMVGITTMQIWYYAGWRSEPEEWAAKFSGGFIADVWQHFIILLEPFNFQEQRVYLHQLWTIPVSWPKTQSKADSM
jgi:peptidoglycan/LPS O-acetylase OafA/YrhL